MPTDTYYKNLFTKPLVLSEQQLEIIINTLSAAMTQKRFQTVAETVRFVMTQLGETAFSIRHEMLVYICYKVCYRRKKELVDKPVRKMFRPLYSAIKGNPLFTYRVVSEFGERPYMEVHLNPQCFSCKHYSLQNGCKICRGKKYSMEEPEASCELFLEKQNVNRENEKSVQISHGVPYLTKIAKDSKEIVKALKKYEKKGVI